MESVKSRIFVILGILAFIFGAIGLFCYMENYEGIYYTQIDNTKISKLNTSSAMKYEYTLDCYNENGHKKKISFKTTRELKDKAFLSLTVKATGVNKWEEVQIYELPSEVHAKYSK